MILAVNPNESIDKDLAIALKQDPDSKKYLMRALTSYNIDFNRSIKSAVKISPSDPRLQAHHGRRIIIGVYNNHDTGTKNLSAWILEEDGTTESLSGKFAGITIETPDGKLVKLPKNYKVFLPTWTRYMSSIYIIEFNEKTSVNPLRFERFKNNVKSEEEFYSTDITRKFALRLCKKYGVKVISLRHTEFIIDVRLEYTLNKSSRIDLKYDDSTNELVAQPFNRGYSFLDAKDIKNLVDKYNNLLAFMNKFNSIDLTKIGIIPSNNQYYDHYVKRGSISL